MEGVNQWSRIKASNKFISILALVSIIGFMSIVSETLFEYDISDYMETLWLLSIGIGLILEGQITRLKYLKEQGLTPTNFAHITTMVVGLISIIAGIFSLPGINIQSSGFIAVKGIVALITIIIIVIQTWVID